MDDDLTLGKSRLVIRDARSDELDEVSFLIRDAYRQYEKSVPPGAWESFVEDMMDVRSRLSEAELIVAEMSERLVGTVTLYLNGSLSQRERWPAGWAGIRLLAVHPQYRGQGIGRALMQHCVRRCWEEGIKTVALHTTQIMEVARQIYEQMGFVRVPEFDFLPAPDIVVMAYRLELP